jgi:hypothetical protein
MFGKFPIGDEFTLGEDLDLLCAEEIKDILGLQPALIELLEFIIIDLAVPFHGDDSK